jgi:phospholipase/carboxylesterase
MTNTEKDIHEIGNWILRMRHPHDQEPTRLLLLLHGWTGDENSMWIFTPRVPDNYLVVSPRGMYPTSLGGYGWRGGEIDGWSKIGDFSEAIEALLRLIDSEIVSYVAVENFSLMGFSQGAALSYAMTLMYPQRIDKLLGISGFMPDGAEDYVEGEELQGKTAFVAHGRMDNIVPIKKARKVVNVLKQAGAEVTYCEDDVGHKLSSSCFRGLNHYLVRDS